MNNKKLKNVGEGVESSDAITKHQLETAINFTLTRQKLIFLVVQVNNLADYLHEARASFIPVFFFQLGVRQILRNTPPEIKSRVPCLRFDSSMTESYLL